MPKYIKPDLLDAALVGITAATRAIVCKGLPADYAAAQVLSDDGGLVVCWADLAPADFTLLPGDINGRKVRVEGKTTTVNKEDSGGNANHLAFVDDVAGELLYVTTFSNVGVAYGAKFTWAAFDVLELRNP